MLRNPIGERFYSFAATMHTLGGFAWFVQNINCGKHHKPKDA